MTPKASWLSGEEHPVSYRCRCCLRRVGDPTPTRRTISPEKPAPPREAAGEADR